MMLRLRFHGSAISELPSFVYRWQPEGVGLVPIWLGAGERPPDRDLCVFDLLEAPQDILFGVSETNPAEKPERY